MQPEKKTKTWRMSMNTNAEYKDLRNILHHPGIPLTYLSNPKVACSTIKNSLLNGCDGNVHSEIEQICTHPNDQHHTIFTVTRNPFSRALSCYKNKIGWGKEATGQIWSNFSKRFNLPLKYQPSFYEYLKKLADSEDSPESFDIHYRPQFFCLHAKHITPSYVGRLEHPQNLREFLGRFSIDLQTRNPRPTQSSETYRHEIKPEEAELIQTIYAVDFEHYGYQPELETLGTPPPIEQNAAISDLYLLRFRLANLGLTTVELRGIARRRERNGDLTGALLLQRQLQLLNPDAKDSRRAIRRLTLEIETQDIKANR